jgi:diguanylate cyclase (GGDEF)-like protein
MARRIILLDDDPGLAGRHERMLKENGYEVLRPKAVGDVRVLLDTGQISVVVHSCNKTKTHTPMCQQISELHPEVPTLHLETGNGICRDHKKHGLLHRVVGHLGPERAFIKLIRNLSTLGRLKFREKVQQSIINEIELVDELLKDLEGPRLVQVMLEQIENWTGAANVVWMTPADIDYYVNEIWKVKSLSSAEAFVKPSEERAVCRHQIEPQDVTAVLNQVNGIWDESWKDSKGPLISDGLMVLPIFDPEDRSTMGYFFAIQPNHMKTGVRYWLKRFGFALKQSTKYMEARSLCYIDDVTELYNQRYLGLALDAEIGRATRNESPFSVLFMDVDHFKKINDEKGHLVGSAILKKISRILKKNIRNFDYGFRYGGDEYLLLLVNTASEGASVVAERIRKEVEMTVFRVEGVEVKVTLSIGVASFPEHAATKEEIVALADKAMYHGKSKSRNVVFVAS